MKKLICTILALVLCTLTCSCTFIKLKQDQIGYAADKMSVRYDDYYKNDDYRSFLEKIQVFSSTLSERLISKYGESENTVISPISVYMALALACECAEGETRDEILNAVGVTYDEVSLYTKQLYAFCNQEFKSISAIGLEQTDAYEDLTNSLWIDRDLTYIQEGIDRLAENYNCDSFKTSFATDEASKLINDYIKDKTNGLIKGDLDFDPETVFVLMNTFYLKEIWNETGRDLEFTSEYYGFKATDGSESSTKLLQGYYNGGKVYEEEDHKTFYTTTEHGFKIYFIIPKDGYTAASVMTDENIINTIQRKDWCFYDDEKLEKYYTRVLFPEFEADFNKDIRPTLEEDFAIKSFFDPDKCDVSGVFAGDAYCQSVIHRASLTVNKKGIEGAAITVMPVCGAAGPGEYLQVYEDLIVDKAFGFILTDTYGTILFSGVINDIK